MSQEASKFGVTGTSYSGMPPGDHIAGIDSLRAIAALTVMFDHLGYLPSNLFEDHHGHIFALIRLILNCTFNGPAAVIIFFVVSGFFIHLPQTRKNRELNIGRFYTRRFVRIGIPAFATVIAFKSLGLSRLADLNNTVLWSVICEAIYYFLYPVLLLLGQKFGWAKVVVVAYVMSFVLCVTHLGELKAHGNGYIALGWWTWLVGLPCWVLGCWLAENRQKFRLATSLQMWMIRLTILALSVVLRIVKFHVHSAGASNCFTLNFFALPVTVWIGVELASSAKLGTSRLLEWIGKWSYSIYLMHPISTSLLALVGIVELKNSEPYLLLRLTGSLVLAYSFFLLVEKPGHRLAIRLSRRAPTLSNAIS
jgi:peptidoglycan/LPS O-acetylase OafA/YrhL